MSNAVSKTFHEQMGEEDNEFDNLSETEKMSFALHRILVIYFLVIMTVMIYFCHRKFLFDINFKDFMKL